MFFWPPCKIFELLFICRIFDFAFYEKVRIANELPQYASFEIKKVAISVRPQACRSAAAAR